MRADLGALRTRLGEAAGPDRELDMAICVALQSQPADYERAVVHGKPMLYFWHKEDTKAPHISVPDYTGSLDAILALVEEKRPGGALMHLGWVLRNFPVTEDYTGLARRVCTSLLDFLVAREDM